LPFVQENASIHRPNHERKKGCLLQA
jgi:hypothetical protein